MNTQARLLEIRDLSLAVKNDKGARGILHDINITCDRGDFIALVGESGSGKSMTLRTIVGLTPPGSETTGEVLCEGQDVLKFSSRQILEHRRSKVSMIFQDPRAHINPYQTVGAFLTEAMRQNLGMSKKDAIKRATELLEEVGLPRPETQLAKHPHELSGGMLQRVMIASALAGEPELLLADEPTTALDVTTQAEIVAILQELRKTRDLAIILVTHDLDLAASSCDRISVMRYGEIVEENSAVELWKSPKHVYTQKLLNSMPARLQKTRVKEVDSE